MPDSEPSHTASQDPRKEELVSLFRQWDTADGGTGQRARVATQGIWLRVGVTVALTVAATLVMSMTAASAGFWTEPNAPREFEDLRVDYERSGGAQTLGPANAHVLLRGLVPTRLMAVAEKDTPTPDELAYLFFCPLRRIVVFTSQPLRVDPQQAQSADPRLQRLVNERLALPEETAVSVTARGRLLPGDQAPSELQPFVNSFAQRVQQAPGDLWVLVDGARPSDMTWAALVWALAAAAPLLSLVFLVRAVRQLKLAPGARP